MLWFHKWNRAEVASQSESFLWSLHGVRISGFHLRALVSDEDSHLLVFVFLRVLEKYKRCPTGCSVFLIKPSVEHVIFLSVSFFFFSNVNSGKNKKQKKNMFSNIVIQHYWFWIKFYNITNNRSILILLSPTDNNKHSYFLDLLAPLCCFLLFWPRCYNHSSLRRPWVKRKSDPIFSILSITFRTTCPQGVFCI